MVDGSGHAFVGVDVPARSAFEPAAAGQREATTVARSLEGTFGDDGIAADHLEVEARLEGFVAEAKLHQGRLEQNAAFFEQGHELGGVFAPDVDGWVARVAALEAREDAQGPSIGGGGQGLPVQGHARQEWDARFGVEHGHGQPALANVDAKLEALRPNHALRRQPRAQAGGPRAAVG
jgi:hypothetical protein